MEGRCPFCWSPNVNRVGASPGKRPRDGYGGLMECADCERWYWTGSSHEIPLLFEICATLMIRPGLCPEEVRGIVCSGGNTFPRRRAAELNHLCSQCLRARFLPDKASLHA
jgi:hypothetical protein